MARIDLEADKELSKLGLLRAAVIAKLLKVAPKTVHAWAKDLNVTKVRNVKYLTWKEVLEKKFDSYDGPQPEDCELAYKRWKASNTVTKHMDNELKTLGIVATKLEPADVQANVAKVLAKAKALLPPKAVSIGTVVAALPDVVLDLPVREEVILKLPEEK